MAQTDPLLATPRGGPYSQVIAGAGGIISSAKDMARWLQTLLLKGRHPESNQVIIPEAAVQAVSTGYTVNTDQPYASLPLVLPATYGGGSIIRNWRGSVIIEHGGSINGFKSMIARLPNEGFGFAVLTNDHDLGGNIAFALVSRLTDEALGLTPVDSKGDSELFINLAYTYAPQPLPRPSSPTSPTESLDDHAGVYEHPAYGTGYQPESTSS
ncbi:hypothetical protein ONZ45_g6995 [Pleurotus djamor]|nr:hypothetical protein ONZ45_g6995 [Pleurotus djamor]